MSDDWMTLLKRPDEFADGPSVRHWFDRIAERLLNGSQLVVGGEANRLTEIEFYYHGPGHQDPFAHRDPVQLHCGRWYFHKTAGVYRGGSFKGLDLAFGHDSAHAGILFRGLEKPDGDLVDGPSLLVDYLLKQTGEPDVPTLDATVGGKLAWDEGNPVYLKWVDGLDAKEIVRCGRVGLSLKKAKATSKSHPEYIVRSYRYLSEPRRIAKGKPYLILSLHAQGYSVDDIAKLTGSTKTVISRYIQDYDTGKASADFAEYFGKDLPPAVLCKLHGTWHGKFGG